MTEDLMLSFQILLLGWGGIFLVMIIIYLTSVLLTKAFPPRKE